MSVTFDLIPASFDELPVDEVIAARTYLESLWRSADPTLDVSHGALSALVVNPSATLLTAARRAYALARRSSSFTALLSDTSEISSEMLDVLAANYRVTRKAGSTASGTVRIVVSTYVDYVVAGASRFTANNRTFRPVRNYMVSRLVDNRILSGREIPLYRMPDSGGYYYFDIEVEALEPGLAGNLPRGTEMEMPTDRLPFLVTLYALQTFQNGTDSEPNSLLAARCREGLSAKVLCSRLNMRAALALEFPDIRSSSIIGFGDREMTRDSHTAFPGASGGCVDWYVATTRQLATRTIVCTDLVEMKNFDDGSRIYKTEINTEEIPCLYAVTEICGHAVEADGTRIICDILGQDYFLRQNIEQNAPRITETVEGVFSPYQSTDVYYRAPAILEAVEMTVTYMPEIDKIQKWVTESDVAPLGLDILVKGAFATTVRVGCKLHIPAGESVDEAQLKNAVADYINDLPFDGVLTTSHITAILHRHLPAGGFLSDPVIFAKTYLPDGRTALSQSTDRLIIDLPPYATNRTVIFYCDPADVTFSTTPDSPDSQFAKTYVS